jgi:hypothetical protein
MSSGCPQCLAGDHDRCDRKVWDEAEGRYSPCPCAMSKHLERRQM